MEKSKDKAVLMKAVSDVLEEALNELEVLKKDDHEIVGDPSKPAPAPQGNEGQEIAEESEEDKKKKKGKKDDEDGDEDDDGDEDEDMDDETMKSEYAKITSKMQERGLLQKTEAVATPVAPAAAPVVQAPAAEVQKSETAQETESLKKSLGEQNVVIEDLRKTIGDLTSKIEKIGSAPVARKGVSGLAPLRKNEGEEEGQERLNKAETVDSLLDLKKSGKSVDTNLITRIETGRHSAEDLKQIKRLLGK